MASEAGDLSGDRPRKEKCKEVYLTARLLVKTKFPKSVGVIAMVGLEFYKEENLIMYAMSGKNCMKVGEIF